MSKVIQVLVLGIVGLVAISAVGPTLAALARQLVPLALVVGLLAIGWQVVRYLTRP